LKKDEEVVELKRKGCANPKGNKEKIEEMCRAFNIPLKKRIREIKHGWCNQPKDALQLLYERGFIDPSLPNPEKYYTIKGRKKRDGSLDLSTSLTYLLNLLPDFQDEETMLMVYGKQMGVSVDRPPKCHLEMAGEGIEYVWAGSKQAFRLTPLTLQRNKKGFHAFLVRNCLDEKTLNLIYMRKCTAHARRYMLAYHSLAKNATTSAGNKDEKVGFDLIQSLVKKHKSHRNITDSDSFFVKNMLNDMKSCGKEE
jgi:hypothetical protein